ncbi:hypothetical protein BC2230_30535 [Burkholderia cepacia]
MIRRTQAAIRYAALGETPPAECSRESGVCAQPTGLQSPKTNSAAGTENRFHPRNAGSST